ncbi:P-loop containing nucleoside triphosphate hydrolase protein [Mycena olivaceomarginata]|nr:P-loop containing nucleoside triphosphate hydrolase protein [Mycena olivaceomarginata]
MPPEITIAETRMNDIITSLKPTIRLLNDIHGAVGTPFVGVISSTTLSLINAIENAKKYKEESLRVMEDIHGVIYAILECHIKSESAGSLPPVMLDELGKFTQTLCKIDTFFQVQNEGNKIKNFFRQREINMLLKDCQAGLKHSSEVFKVKSGTTILTSLKDMQEAADNIQTEILELISTLSEPTTSDTASSMYRTLNSSQASSESFSMLPAAPKIFHGRQSQLTDLVQVLDKGSARVAILGPGGIGKTSLARAVLHHPEIVAKYESRFFVPCDSASTSIELAALIGAHLGLKPENNLTNLVIQHLAGIPASLLILDNLETAWEPMISRRGVEKFLALLTDIPCLTLIITMRGVERPAQVHWTRPFLPPLEPLSNDAARQTFIEIADDFHEPREIDQLLHLTDNMPLAVDLIAHLVGYEGCSNILMRWETEKTALISNGFDRHSSLDTSIQISLSSPRITSSPGAMDLLRLLSILPDGLSNMELLQSGLPIQDILSCKAVLLGTSLAYSDGQKRLKSLIPIREHVQHHHHPTESLILPLQKYFQALLNFYRKYGGSHRIAETITQITLNLGNLHQILLLGLHSKNFDLADIIACTCSLSEFNQLTGRGHHPLMDHIPNVLSDPCDPRLEVLYITELQPYPTSIIASRI